MTTLDLVLIQRHILGLTELDSPFKLLAADVDLSETLTAQDIVEVRKLLLGTEMEFSFTNSWRFVSEDNVFFDPKNPYWSLVQQTFLVSDFVTDMEANFRGIKMGDVNEDAMSDLESRSGEIITLETADIDLQAGQIYRIPLHIEKELIDLLGLQFTIDHKGLELIEVNSGRMKMTNEYYYTDIYSEQTALSWTAYTSESFDTKDIVFELVLKARQDAKLSDLLSINSDKLKNETYRTANIDIGEINLDFIDSGLSLSMSQNRPNPWSESTEIEFTIPESGLVDITIWNLNGEQVYHTSNLFEAGQNTYKIQKEDLRNNGMYLLEMNFQDDVERQRMLLLE